MLGFSFTFGNGKRRPTNGMGNRSLPYTRPRTTYGMNEERKKKKMDIASVDCDEGGMRW